MTLTQRTQRKTAKGRKVTTLCALCEEPLRPLRFNFVGLLHATEFRHSLSRTGLLTVAPSDVQRLLVRNSTNTPISVKLLTCATSDSLVRLWNRSFGAVHEV